MARLEGIEPPTYGLEIRCSIQLSYRRSAGTDSVPGRARGRERPAAAPRRVSSMNPVQPPAAGRKLVGARGFEPPTPCSQSRCATGLRHAPMKLGGESAGNDRRAFPRASNAGAARVRARPDHRYSAFTPPQVRCTVGVKRQSAPPCHVATSLSTPFAGPESVKLSAATAVVTASRVK